MLLSLLAFLWLWQGNGLWVAALSGALGGLALLTKLPSPLIVPFIGLLAIAGWWQDRRTVFWLKAVFIWGLIALLVFVLLWPAAWVDPLGTIQRMLRDTFEVGEVGEGHLTYYRGQVIKDPGWGFYPYAVAFRLTPVVGVGLALLILALGRSRQADHAVKLRGLALILIIYVLFIYVFSSLSPKKLDRYVMAVFPAIDVLAAVGFAQLLNLKYHVSNTQSPTPNLQLVLWLLIVGVLVVAFVVPNYPYYLSYYNPMLAGIAGAVREVPVGWGEGLEEAAAWLNAQSGAENLRVAAWYSDIFFPYFVGERVSFSSSGKSQLAADYVVFYVNQVQRQKPDPGLVAYFVSREPSYVVTIDGVDWAWVYPAPNMMYQASGKTRITGRAWLLGYSLENSPRPGETLPLVLYLRVVGEMPSTETLDVRLVAPDGRLVGEWHDTGRPDGWTPDAVVEWYGTLSLPADLRTGDYRLDMGLRSLETGQPLARFVWNEADEGWLMVTESEK
jgi:hypothetical protein